MFDVHAIADVRVRQSWTWSTFADPVQSNPWMDPIYVQLWWTKAYYR